MKAKVYEHNEEAFFLKLFDCTEGVELRVVSPSGRPADSGCILMITNEGTLQLRSGLNRHLGIATDPDGVIRR